MAHGLKRLSKATVAGGLFRRRHPYHGEQEYRIERLFQPRGVRAERRWSDRIDFASPSRQEVAGPICLRWLRPAHHRPWIVMLVLARQPDLEARQTDVRIRQLNGQPDRFWRRQRAVFSAVCRVGEGRGSR